MMPNCSCPNSPLVIILTFSTIGATIGFEFLIKPRLLVVLGDWAISNPILFRLGISLSEESVARHEWRMFRRAERAVMEIARYEPCMRVGRFGRPTHLLQKAYDSVMARFAADRIRCHELRQLLAST